MTGIALKEVKPSRTFVRCMAAAVIRIKYMATQKLELRRMMGG